MQHTLVELERTPDSASNSAQRTIPGKKAPLRLHKLRFYLYLLRGVLLLVLTCTVFTKGTGIIRQNAKALGFFALNFDVPLPFLFIGIWAIAVLFLTIFTVSAWMKVVRMLSPLLRRSTLAQRKAA